jgi:tetratricopeptide (TPR) repeat protein
MTAQALPKVQELTDKINSLLLKKRKPNTFEIRLLTKEADSLKGKIDYEDYYNLLGRISSLENNKQGIISNFEKAIKLSPTDYAAQSSYAIALQCRGLISQAMEQAKKLVDIFPNDSEALIFIIEINLLSCKFREALELLKNLENQEGFYAYNLINQAVAIFDYAKLSDDEAQYLQELAYSIIKTENIYFSGCETRIIEGCVHQTIYVDVPIEQTTHINWELAGVFADNVEDMRSDVLMFEYSSIDILDERKKYDRII